MNYFVVVGGSQFQSGLVDAAFRKNFGVIVVDKNPCCYCNTNYENIVFINESVRNINAVLQSLRDYTIIGAATAQSDFGVLLVETICSEFNVGYGSLNAARIFTNKFLFKNFLFQSGLTLLKPHLINRDSIISLNVDWSESYVLKPIDSSGSRGLRFVKSLDDLILNIDSVLSHSFEGAAILEPLIVGVERGAQVIIDSNGQYLVCNHNDVLFNNIPVAHSLLPENAELNSKIERLIKELDLRSCILNVDYFQCDNSIEFIEIGMRLGATELDVLLSTVLDKNIYDIIVEGYNIDDLRVNMTKMTHTFGILFNPFEKVLTLRKNFPVDSTEFIFNEGLIHFKFDFGAFQLDYLNSGVSRFGSFSTTLWPLNIVELMTSILNEYSEE